MIASFLNDDCCLTVRAGFRRIEGFVSALLIEHIILRFRYLVMCGTVSSVYRPIPGLGYSLVDKVAPGSLPGFTDGFVFTACLHDVLVFHDGAIELTVGNVMQSIYFIQNPSYMLPDPNTQLPPLNQSIYHL